LNSLESTISYDNDIQIYLTTNISPKMLSVASELMQRGTMSDDNPKIQISVFGIYNRTPRLYQPQKIATKSGIADKKFCL
jgi:hypothetical protein